MAPDQPGSRQTPVKEKPVLPQKRTSIIQNIQSAAVSFLLEILAPSLVALVLLYFLSGSVKSLVARP